MPPVEHTAPRHNPEQRPRFSKKTIEEGNLIFDGKEGVAYFDETKYPIELRIVMSAKRHKILTAYQTYKDLSDELQKYLVFRMRDEEEKEKRIEEALRIDKKNAEEKYLLSKDRIHGLHPEDEREEIERLEKWFRNI